MTGTSAPEPRAPGKNSGRLLFSFLFSLLSLCSSRALTMPPVSASKAKRQAEKAAKASKKGTPKDTESINGSTVVGSSAAPTVVGDDDVAAATVDMKKLAIATDRYASYYNGHDLSV
jgi:hypothetical protein